MNEEELTKSCLIARNMEDRARNMKYYNAKSLDDLSEFVNTATRNLPWHLTKSILPFQENNLKDAQDKIGDRHSLKSEKDRKELHRAVLFSIGLALSSHAGDLNAMIDGIKKQLPPNDPDV